MCIDFEHSSEQLWIFLLKLNWNVIMWFSEYRSIQSNVIILTFFRKLLFFSEPVLSSWMMTCMSKVFNFLTASFPLPLTPESQAYQILERRNPACFHFLTFLSRAVRFFFSALKNSARLHAVMTSSQKMSWDENKYSFCILRSLWASAIIGIQGK